MKRKITFLIAVIAAIMLITQPMKVLATEWSYTFNASSDIQKGSNTLNSVAWTIDHDSQYSNNEAAGYHVGSSSKPVSYLQASTTGISGTITKIVVNAKGNGSGGTIGVSVNGTAYTAKDNNTSITNTSQNFEFTGSLGGEIIIRLSYSSAISKNFFLSSITVTYSVGATYTVTYNANGGTVGTVPTDATSYANGATVTVKNRNTLDYSSTSPDKGFKGWNTQADGLGTFYHPGATFTMGSSNVNLYAVWTTRCAFAYDDNGADDGDVPDSYYTSYGTGAKVVVLGNTGELEKDAAVWEGWNTTDNGSGTTYQEGDSFIIESNVTLYAKWRELATYTLVTKVADIEPGKHYIIASSKTVGDANATAMGSQGDNNRSAVAVSVSTISTKTKITEASGMYEFVISGDASNNYTIYDESNSKYLFAAGSGSGKNYLRSQNGIDGNSKWTITFSSDAAVITAQGTNTNKLMRKNSSSAIFSCYYSGQNAVYLYKKDTDSGTTYYSPTAISEEDPDIDDTPITVLNNEILTLTGDITCTDAANLIIEDGGQLICNSSVPATFKKTMTTPTKTDVYGWELISSPVHDGTGSTIAVENVDNLTNNGAYDMFAYDEEYHMWRTQKNEGGATGFTTLNNGEGYMYRNSGNELSFVGNTNSDAVAVVRVLTYTTGDLAGFHLVGNPYTHSITVKDNVSLLGDGDVALESGKQLSGYYLLTNGGSEWTSKLGTTTDIATKQGFLIQIPAEAKKIKFSNGAKKDRANADNIMFTVSNSQFNDVAYALFDDAFGLNKINHRDADAPMLYINQNGQDYAIAAMSDDTKSFNLNFKAGTISQYTLSYKADGKFEYLHVIDRLTGEDVDMLLEGEYSFIGHPKDNENRFIVRLAYASDNNDSSNDIFAYQSGSEIYVTGNGELQIFDVTGRRVMTTTINGAESINIPAQGVYIFRLNEKVQKIVVR